MEAAIKAEKPATVTTLAEMGKQGSALLKALNRHRGKSQQNVVVEHVHVHEGGQAVVAEGNCPPTRVSAILKAARDLV